MIGYTDRLSDSEKFVVILQKYAHEYTTQKELAKEMGIPKQAISDWKKNIRTIRINNRNSISKRFQLNDMIWIESFDDAVNFEEKLDNYRIKVKSIADRSKNLFSSINIISPTSQITLNEQQLIDNFSKEKCIDIAQLTLIEMSSMSLFEIAKLFKQNSQIDEALEVLEIIEKKEGSFKYSHHNQIEHLKAILFSHETLQNWDKSIDILRLLYVANYHLEEPEIITLLASNYKRKALYSSNRDERWILPTQIDLNLLSSALILYREAYEAKKGQKRYYEAINFAYLYSMIELLEGEEPTFSELKEMYTELMAEWSVISSDWWEVSSHAEFLMLTGQIELAIHNITVFLEEQSLDIFNIETTLRQLELYLHFTKDTNAEQFYNYLQESWKYIKG